MTEEASFFGLTGKKAMVIGGGQGMGESTSRFLARAGCDVAVIDLERNRAERVAGLVNGFGRRGVPIIGDVLDDAQIPRIVAETERELGGIDVMVSIVGAAAWGSLLETTAAVWDQQARLNLRYFFLCAREVAAAMIKRGSPGAIVTPRLYDTPQRVEGYANSLLPMRHRGTPDDIGKAALFLASDLASYITGTTLDVDGGLLAANLFPMGLPGSNRG